MAEIQKIADITKETVAAYFDLEFCNDKISRHNIPIAIGISYRQGEEEIGSYHSLIWCGDELELWEEQLDNIGYAKTDLRENGKSMEGITEDLLVLHKKYQPKLYISFGKQDEDLLKKFVTKKLQSWQFSDAIAFLSNAFHMRYDISLEKYAYICRLLFVHIYDPMADARVLAEIVWCALMGNEDKVRCKEVSKEYDRKMFLIEYQNKKQAYEYLKSLQAPTPKQREKLALHEAYLKRNLEQYQIYRKQS